MNKALVFDDNFTGPYRINGRDCFLTAEKLVTNYYTDYTVWKGSTGEALNFYKGARWEAEEALAWSAEQYRKKGREGTLRLPTLYDVLHTAAQSKDFEKSVFSSPREWVSQLFLQPNGETESCMDVILDADHGESVLKRSRKPRILNPVKSYDENGRVIVIAHAFELPKDFGIKSVYDPEDLDEHTGFVSRSRPKTGNPQKYSILFVPGRPRGARSISLDHGTGALEMQFQHWSPFPASMRAVAEGDPHEFLDFSGKKVRTVTARGLVLEYLDQAEDADPDKTKKREARGGYMSLQTALKTLGAERLFRGLRRKVENSE